MDDYLDFNNTVIDELIDPSGEVHPQDIDIDLSDGNGDEIKIGDSIITNITNSSNEPDYRFIFTGEGIVNQMSTFFDGRKTLEGKYIINENHINVFYDRYFNCWKRDGSEYKDSMREGTLSCASIKYCYKRLPNDYLERYVKICIKRRFNPCKVHDSCDEFDIWLWLEHFGILSEVKRLYSELVGKKKCNKSKINNRSSEVNDSKLKDIVAGLTDKEKEELLKMLQK